MPKLLKLVMYYCLLSEASFSLRIITTGSKVKVNKSLFPLRAVRRSFICFLLHTPPEDAISMAYQINYWAYQVTYCHQKNIKFSWIFPLLSTRMSVIFILVYKSSLCKKDIIYCPMCCKFFTPLVFLPYIFTYTFYVYKFDWGNSFPLWFMKSLTDQDYININVLVCSCNSETLNSSILFRIYFSYVLSYG